MSAHGLVERHDDHCVCSCGAVMPVVNTRAAQERAFWAHRAREEQ